MNPRHLAQVHTPRVDSLLHQFAEVRQKTKELCAPLMPEDYAMQSSQETSPPKWHLGHTTWFFEELVLKKFDSGFCEFHPSFSFLFNSYYNSAGDYLEQAKRHLLIRPLIHEVFSYRKKTEEAIYKMLKEQEAFSLEQQKELNYLMVLGIQHEKQHQELLITDIKYNYYSNPLYPSYQPDSLAKKFSSELSHQAKASFAENSTIPSLKFLDVEGGLKLIGSDPANGFCYDNETPTHQIYCDDFQFANRLVNCGEYLDFIEDGGYTNFRYWLSEGWEWIRSNDIRSPLYWKKIEGQWNRFHLHEGFSPLERHEPVCHVSLYEACAYANWAGKRLPTEIEWEVAALQGCIAEDTEYADQMFFHPKEPFSINTSSESESFSFNGREGATIYQLFGTVWEWTRSPYVPYPGFSPMPGALGEYNAKFMIGQNVLRGGSCASPTEHIRPGTRNFLLPPQRWQFSGIRLASDAKS